MPGYHPALHFLPLQRHSGTIHMRPNPQFATTLLTGDVVVTHAVALCYNISRLLWAVFTNHYLTRN